MVSCSIFGLNHERRTYWKFFLLRWVVDPLFPKLVSRIEEVLGDLSARVTFGNQNGSDSKLQVPLSFWLWHFYSSKVSPSSINHFIHEREMGLDIFWWIWESNIEDVLLLCEFGRTGSMGSEECSPLLVKGTLSGVTYTFQGESFERNTSIGYLIHLVKK